MHVSSWINQRILGSVKNWGSRHLWSEQKWGPKNEAIKTLINIEITNSIVSNKCHVFNNNN